MTRAGVVDWHINKTVKTLIPTVTSGRQKAEVLKTPRPASAWPPPGNSSYHPHLPPSRVLILALPAVCPEPTTTFAGRSQEGISPKQRPSSHHMAVSGEKPPPPPPPATASGGIYSLSHPPLDSCGPCDVCDLVTWPALVLFVSLDSCG